MIFHELYTYFISEFYLLALPFSETEITNYLLFSILVLILFYMTLNLVKTVVYMFLNIMKG